MTKIDKKDGTNFTFKYRIYTTEIQSKMQRCNSDDETNEHNDQSCHDDEASSAKLVELKSSIEQSHDQLIQMMASNSFTSKVIEFNEEAKRLITESLVSEALIYLNQAERILQYAANRGKQINRTLIVTVLHNQACCYQQTWNLSRCSDYVEALIYNTNSQLKDFENTSPLRNNQHFSSEKESRLPNGSGLVCVQSLPKKTALAKYYLLFCALNSQLKKNSAAMIAAKKSNKLIRKTFSDLNMFLSKLKFISSETHDKNRLSIVRELSSLKESYESKDIDVLIAGAKYYLAIWKNKCSLPNFSIKPVVDQFKDYSIGNIMQIDPLSFDLNQSQSKINSNNKIGSGHCKALPQELQYRHIACRVIVLSISYFTIATQLRLLASQRCKSTKEEVKTSSEFKESQAYHLLSIIIVAMYMPFDMLYMEHIIKSFANHYQINLYAQRQEQFTVEDYQAALFTQDCKLISRKPSFKDDLVHDSSIIEALYVEEPKKSQNPSKVHKKSEKSYYEQSLNRAELNKLNNYYYSSQENQPQEVGSNERYLKNTKKLNQKNQTKSKSKNKNTLLPMKSKERQMNIIKPQRISVKKTKSPSNKLISIYTNSFTHSTQKTPKQKSPLTLSPTKPKQTFSSQIERLRLKDNNDIARAKSKKSTKHSEKENIKNVQDQYFITQNVSHLNSQRSSHKKQNKGLFRQKSIAKNELISKSKNNSSKKKSLLNKNQNNDELTKEDIHEDYYFTNNNSRVEEQKQQIKRHQTKLRQCKSPQNKSKIKSTKKNYQVLSAKAHFQIHYK